MQNLKKNNNNKNNLDLAYFSIYIDSLSNKNLKIVIDKNNSLLKILSIKKTKKLSIAKTLKKKFIVKILIFILSFFLIILMTSCQTFHKSKIGKEITEKDFAKILMDDGEKEIIKKKIKNNEFIIPEELKQKISVNFNKKVSLKKIIKEIRKITNVDIEVINGVQQNINFCARNKKLIEIIEIICEMTNLRYSISNGVIIIENDLPFYKNYSVQFLNFSRLSENKISTSTDIFQNITNQDVRVYEKNKEKFPKNKNEKYYENEKNFNKININENFNNGSNSAVKMVGQNDFWNELEENIKIILTNNSDGTAIEPKYAVHRQAGIISIYGNSQNHKNVKNYIDLIHKTVSSQILIEAKIIEVSLHDEFRSGINWNIISNGVKENNLNIRNNFSDTFQDSSALSQNINNSKFFEFEFAAKNSISSLIRALSFFGTTKILSSPRVTVMNNQNAILKVAKNQVYFRINYNKNIRKTSVGNDEFIIGSDIQTIPIGLILSVQPAIDLRDNSVILFLRPTISRTTETVMDPAVQIALNASGTKTTNISSSVPVVETKEIDSVLKIHDNEVAILGGLMESRSAKTQNKIPKLGDLPVINEIFSSTVSGDEVTELVILIKVKILDEQKPHAADMKLTHLYISDPRPIC